MPLFVGWFLSYVAICLSLSLLIVVCCCLWLLVLLLCVVVCCLLFVVVDCWRLLSFVCCVLLIVVGARWSLWLRVARCFADSVRT